MPDFAELIGTQWISFDPDDARAAIEVAEHHKQPNGIVHGGVYASLAESLCSAATHEAVREDGMVAMGQANDTAFLRPITEGHDRRPRTGPLARPDDVGLGRRDPRLGRTGLRARADDDRSATDARPARIDSARCFVEAGGG